MAHRLRRRTTGVAVVAGLTLFLMASPLQAKAPAGGLGLDPATQFYVAQPLHGALQQVGQLKAAGDKADAALIQKMIDTPQAVWFTSGTPQSVQQAVKGTVQRAAAKGTVPVLVAYNVPGRDCSQYSAGGAPTGDAYRAWIDGFAAGVGSATVVVIVEPDGLALLPTDCGQEDTYDRVDLVNYAAQAFGALPNASAYLDAGHSAWHNVTDMATRLVAGGVQDVAGFYLNPSNYQFTANSVQYGTWISDCIALNLAGCPDQYWNGGPLPSLIAQTIGEWTGAALNPYGVWSDSDTTVVGGQMPFNTSGINLRYATALGSTVPATHFVIDTSRNGVGPWQPTGGFPDPQDWCNPTDRGVGPRPTADTGIPLVDAYLWIKLPGASDGECFRGTTGGIDPLRGTADPAAGLWFPDMALELVHNANPAL